MTLPRHLCVTDRDGDAGYIALMAAILLPVLLMFCAFSVDIARWYVQGEKMQKAADAAALAGVTYIPQDFAGAQSAALAIASNNGFTTTNSTIRICAANGAYPVGASATCQGFKLAPSQLRVDISRIVPNFFASTFGFKDQYISRTSKADFNGPAPMGSPCNTFGNEPGTSNVTGLPAGGNGPGGSALPVPGFSNCSATPHFWANIEGPDTAKSQGDQYMTRTCLTNPVTDGCIGTTNSEYKDQGYYYLIRVVDGSKTGPIRIQVYDPSFVPTSPDCSSLSAPSNNMNPYAPDSSTRYSNTLNSYCSGDYNPGGSLPVSAGSTMVTSYGVLNPTDTQNPNVATPVAGCGRQFKGYGSVPTTAQLRTQSELTQVFHQWYQLCTINPAPTDKNVDYYVKIRTNVPYGGANNTNVATNNNVYDGASSAAGEGSNAFAMRAIASDGTQVSVAGWQRMSIFTNEKSTSVAAKPTFNLIKVLPGAAGKTMSFTYFDPGDTSAGGNQRFNVQVLKPTDATGSIATAGNLSGCGGSGFATMVSSSCLAYATPASGNGKMETIRVPIPADYGCNYSTNGGCWFRVSTWFGDETTVSTTFPTDITTWTADIDGDPVRLTK